LCFGCREVCCKSKNNKNKTKKRNEREREALHPEGVLTTTAKSVLHLHHSARKA
jgi:hypothetical protein